MSMARRAISARPYRVRQSEVLIGERAAVDGFAAGAVIVGEVTALAHELRDDAVEAAPQVPLAL
jgi:hypothetical protein